MSTELIVNASLPEVRIALMEGGEIQDLLIERPSGKGIVGNIYKGRVTRVLPGMQAAFVDIGLEKAAFLYVDDVHVHSEVFDEEENDRSQSKEAARELRKATGEAEPSSESQDQEPASGSKKIIVGAAAAAAAVEGQALAEAGAEADEDIGGQVLSEDSPFEDDDLTGEIESRLEGDLGDEEDDEDGESEEDDSEDDFEDGDEEEEGDDGDDEPVAMGPEGDGDGNGDGGGQPEGTVSPDSRPGESSAAADARRRRRGRRGGRNRKRNRNEGAEGGAERPASEPISAANYGNSAGADEEDGGQVDRTSDRAYLGQDEGEGQGSRTTTVDEPGQAGRPEIRVSGEGGSRSTVNKKDFKASRGRDRRIHSRGTSGGSGGGRQGRGPVSIQDLLKEGQEVLVQIAKDPIATKGARLTCHISLPGRHLVCMPTIDHVGVSRRIDKDEERRRLRDVVEQNRPKKLGFIVRTASGKGQAAENRIKQDIDYLSHLWDEIREKAASSHAPALVYEDLNSVLRVIRDWVNEDIDRIVVDSRYHFNDIMKFASHFMPSLRQKVELYQGEAPLFDQRGISTELARAMERKVWLKSGGYIVVDQAEALVAIDVNTGRYVGKKSLEDTILKTNLEAVDEIAYQLRLRNCGGIIILDLIDMEKEENKQRVYRALEEALKKDRARPSILKISELGLVEMTRKRTRDTIVRALCDSCTSCEGKGYVKSKQTIAYEILRDIERFGAEKEATKLLVQAHPDVIDQLAIDDRDTLDQMERRYGKMIYLQSMHDFTGEQFEVVADKTSKAGLRYDRESRRGRGRDRGGDSGSRREKRGGRGGRDRDRERGGGKQRNQASAGGGPKTISTAPAGDEAGVAPGGDDEKLAFLRAQAAQDAALAEGGLPAENGQGGGEPREGGEAGGEGRKGRRGRRGRRGRDNRPPPAPRDPNAPRPVIITRNALAAKSEGGDSSPAPASDSSAE